MSFNNNNKEAESYFEDFDAAPVDDEAPYDDDETFGDTGPLNDEWENQHNLLSEEHESFLKTQSKHIDSLKGDYDNGLDQDQYDEEEEDEDESYSNYQQSRFTNGGGRDVRHFTQSSTTTTTTTTTTTKVQPQQQQQIYEDDNNNNLDDQMESVFKIAMGETTVTNDTNNNNNNINKMMELISSVTIDGNNKVELPTKGMSLSDIENKLFEAQQHGSSTTTETNNTSSPTITPTTTPTKTTITNNIKTYSPKTQNTQPVHNNNNNNTSTMNNRYPRPLTLGDMIGGKQQNHQQNQLHQQQIQQQHQQHQQHHQHQQQQPNQHSPSPRKYNNNKNQNTKNSGDKKYMTAEEIQTINRLQAYQIHFTNPFIEDYYYQRYKIKQSGPTHSHTPICDSTPKTAPSPKKPIGNTDALTGALGRIPSHSIRAPRQILQVILKEDGEGGAAANGEKNQNSDPTIKLIIESSYNHILDLEDIQELIANTNDATLLEEYQQKQEPVSRELFKSLYLDPFPSFKFESPTMPSQEPNQKWPSVCHEDLLFVSLWVFAKGRKLLKRAFPLLNDKQSLSGLFAVCRNLPLLLLLHLPEGSELSTEAIYKTVCKWIMEVPIKFFILGFHFLVNFNQSKFIVKLFQTKEGQSVIHTFLTRGFLIYDQMYLSQHQLALDPMDREQWRDVFDRFFQRITGSLSTIFPFTQQPSIELSQIFQLLMGHCNEQQTQIFHMELSGGNNNNNQQQHQQNNQQQAVQHQQHQQQHQQQHHQQQQFNHQQQQFQQQFHR